jgi:hypothetical protein
VKQKHIIANEFCKGYAACFAGDGMRRLSESDHWLAGWDAANKERIVRNQHLEAYLASIGVESVQIRHMQGVGQ